MSKEIKIGLIGAGWMGKAHTTAFHNARMIFGDDMPVFELVSDVSEDAVAKFAKNMGYNRYTTNWMDVVTDPEIDLVDVAPEPACTTRWQRLLWSTASMSSARSRCLCLLSSPASWLIWLRKRA